MSADHNAPTCNPLDRNPLERHPSLPFHVVGLSRETVDAQTIGRLSATPDDLVAFAKYCRTFGDACVVLGTCHRVELYWLGDTDLTIPFRNWVCERCGPHAPVFLEVRHGESALSHLFAVAAGLRAQRIGETEILGQVRRAWMLARDARLTSAALDALMQRAILAARQIRRKAGFADRAASLGDAAVSLLSRDVAEAHWSTLRALVVGSGVAADSALRALRQRQPASTTVVSRTDTRALELAATLAIIAAPWSMRLNALQQSDVVIFATRSAEPVVTAHDASVVMCARRGNAIWLDLGVPPNVAPDAGHERLLTRTLADLSADAHTGAAHLANEALQQELVRFGVERQRRRQTNDVVRALRPSGPIQFAI